MTALFEMTGQGHRIVAGVEWTGRRRYGRNANQLEKISSVLSFATNHLAISNL